jgi:DNA-binding NarL/FixJ family response regulator
MKPVKKISILLAEDHTMVREGFHRMLDLEDDMQVIGEAKTGREAVAVFEAVRQIVVAAPQAKVIMLSAHNDDAYVDEAAAAGARGFLLKQTSSHVVVEAIREVARGNTFFCTVISKRMTNRDVQEGPRTGSRKSRHSTLTSRELEVLQLIAEGKANKQTAAELGIGIKTVEKHREHLMQKLDIHDTAGLTRYAISAGIIESSVQVTII